MYSLNPGDYTRVRPLFAGLRYNLVVDSVLDGNTPAWVYVDDVAAPRTAWLWDLQDAMLVAGDAHNAATSRALAELMTTKVFPDARARYIPGLSLHYDPVDWEAQMDVLLPGFAPEKATRRYYTFAQPAVDWRAALPVGCALRRLDEASLARADLRNMEHVAGWVRSFWRSDADFVKIGFGFCLLQGDVIAGWCLSVFVSGGNFELGLATMPEYRGRGYATLVAAASVAHCVEHDFTPHWHCWEDNIPSQRAAEKVGFANPTTYTVYRFGL